MEAAREILYRLVKELPENQIPEILDFIGYLKIKNERNLSEDLLQASESSLEFWGNTIDDEVWNNV